MRFIYSKLFVWFVVMLVLATTLVFLDSRGFLSPVREVLLNLPRPAVSLARKVTIPVRNLFGTIFSLRGIVGENAQLKARVQALENQVVATNALQKENTTLREELGFIAKTPATPIPCTVLAQDPGGLTDTAVLSCGKDEGVQPGQAVVSKGYLVGKVLLTGAGSSTALLLTSPDLHVDAKISGADTTGLVRGSFGSGVLMDFLSQTAQITASDLVVTAGINGAIPKDVLIGRVGEVISGNNDLFKKVTLKSPVDFKNLDFVFVLK